LKLKIEDQKLKIKLNPLEMLFSFRGSIEVPLDHITSASTKRPDREWQIRAPGAYVPFLIKTGTYHSKKGKELWYSTIGKDYLIIELSDWDYQRIVLTMGDNETWAERINQVLA
jgi:hypothetical protein